MLNREYGFGGLSRKREETLFSLIGAPLDETNSYYPGTRFAPNAIRRVSESLEWYSFYTEDNFSVHGLYDEGDLIMSPGRIKENINMIRNALTDISSEGRKTILVGGEHTVTLGAAGLMDDETLLIVFDAHLDLRDDYLGSRINHATVMRRILEEHMPSNIIFVGTRAVSTEELEYARENDIKYITTRRIWLYGPSETIRLIERLSRPYSKIYFSIDMDVIDPGFAPGVGTPEPAGLTPWVFLEILLRIIDDRMIGFDLVEVNPVRDCGDSTSSLAAKTIMEAITRYCSETKEC